MHRYPLLIFPVILAVLFLVAAGLSVTLPLTPQDGADEPPEPPRPGFARGVVYADINANGVRDDDEPGIPDVVVSNQREVRLTDANGRWELPAGSRAVFFVTKPRDYALPVDQYNRPQFYYVHQPTALPRMRYPSPEPTGPLPESIDFGLLPSPEPEGFQALFLGDPQPRNLTEVDYLARDIVPDLIGTEAAFGVVLGDVAFNNLSVLDPVSRTLGQVAIPWWYVHGNHDSNFDAPAPHLSIATWQRVFGPNYYSFDVGDVHFVALDNVTWPSPDSYIARLGDVQKTWLARDLAHVSADSRVVLMMHIPLQGGDWNGLALVRDEVWEVLRGRDRTLSFSAHTHTQRHLFFGSAQGWVGTEPHHHVINGTTCGSWWRGEPDEFGIPHATMSDGTPNGYTVATFTGGEEYRLEWRVARAREDYQMHVDVPVRLRLDECAGTMVHVNVFAGSELSVTRMRVAGGDWVATERAVVPDPRFQRLAAAQEDLPDPSACHHMWRAPLPPIAAPGTVLVEVESTDMFGQTHRGNAVVRITPARE